MYSLMLLRQLINFHPKLVRLDCETSVEQAVYLIGKKEFPSQTGSIRLSDWHTMAPTLVTSLVCFHPKLVRLDFETGMYSLMLLRQLISFHSKVVRLDCETLTEPPMPCGLVGVSFHSKVVRLDCETYSESLL